MKDLTASIIIVAFVIALAIWVGKSASDQARQDFQEACSLVNGKATWNGRNWECLK